jgi:hypothetical protein
MADLAPQSKAPDQSGIAQGDNGHPGTDNANAPKIDDKAAITPVPGKDQLAQQRETMAAQADPESAANKSTEKYLPPVVLENGVKPTDSAQAQFMHMIQLQLCSPGLLAAVTPADKPIAGESAAQYQKRESDKLAAREAAIQEEMAPKPPATPTWGEASQQAFKDYLDFVQSRVVPNAVSTLASAGIPEPPGNPLKLPAGMSASDYETQVINGKLKLDLGIDYHKIPGAEDSAKFQNAMIWAGKALDSVREQQENLRINQVDESIDAMGFPRAWHSPAAGNDTAGGAMTSRGDNTASGTKTSAGDNNADGAKMSAAEKSAWLASATDMIDLYSRMARAVSVIDSNHIPVDLPPGIQITRGADGKIQHMVLPMPSDLRQEDPKNAQIIAQSREWLKAADEKIKNAFKDRNLPTLAYTDTVIPEVYDQQGHKISAQARMDKDGNLQDIINPAYVSDSQKKNVADVNLLEQRYATEQVSPGQLAGRVKATAEAVNDSVATWPPEKKAAYDQLKSGSDGSYTTEQLALIKSNSDQDTYNAALEHNTALHSPKGYVKVSQHVQAQEVPFFSPQNLIYSNVGKPMTLQERFYQPGDLVAVKQSGSTEYVLAKDLPNMQDAQALQFYGQKAVVLGMDAAMLAMGGVEIAAAIEGAAALGTAEATMTGGRLLLAAGKGALDLSLGATDPVSNAYWESRDGGKAAMARSWMFMGSMGWGLAAQGAAMLSTDVALGQAQSAQELGQLIQNSDGAVQAADKVSRALMMWGQLPMGATMAANIADQLINFTEPTITASTAAEAAREYNGPGNQGDGKDNTLSRPLVQKTNDIDDSLQNYKAELLQNCTDPAAKKKIEEMFDTAVKVNQPQDSESGKKARADFMQQLAQNLEFSGKDLAILEQMNGGKLSTDQIKQLMDGQKQAASTESNTNMQAYAESVMSRRDPNVTLASKMILLALSRDKNGNLTDNSITTVTDVPDYQTPRMLTVTNLWGKESSGMEGYNLVQGEKQSIALDTHYLTDSLKRSLNGPNLGSASLAVGDELLRAGALSARNYGALLHDLLADGKTSDSEKLRLLADNHTVNLAQVMLALSTQDKLEASAAKSGADRERLAGKNFGTSAADLQKALMDAGASTNNPDLKAMTAALLFAAKRTAENKAEGAAIADGISAMYQATQKTGTPGAFAQLAMTALQKQLMGSDKGDVQTRLDAAAALTLASHGMTPEQAQGIDRQIAQSLAESFSAASPAQKTDILASLLPQRFQALAKDNPALADQISQDSIQLLAAGGKSFDPQKQQQAIAMMHLMPALIAASGAGTREAFLTEMKTLLDGSISTNYSGLKAEALQTIGQLHAADMIPLLRNLATNDQDASVRANALQTLEKIPDPNLADLVSSRMEKEPDVTVARELKNLAYSLGTGDHGDRSKDKEARAALEQYLSDLNARYPELANFDTKAQSEWLATNFPLLSQTNFDKQAQMAITQRPLGLFTSTVGSAQEAVEGVGQQRQAQFDSLLELAKMDTNSGTSAAQKLSIERARTVLAAIIADNGTLVSVPKESFSLGKHLPSIDYSSGVDWSAKAAEALAQISAAGHSQRDLTAGLICGILEQKPTGDAQEYLLAALKNLNAPVKGVSNIPPSVYDYLLDT